MRSTLAKNASRRRHLLAQLPAPNECRQIRLEAGVKGSEVARELGVSRQAVCQWERGTSRPGPQLLGRYVRLIHELRHIVSVQAESAEK